MLIRFATQQDKEKWISLAENIKSIFQAPNMPYEKEFHDYMTKKINHYEAIAAIDRMTENLLGIICFSRTHNRISWFAIFQQYRKKGIGSNLLKCAIDQLDWKREITAETFTEGYTPGLSARKTYSKYGFEEKDILENDKEQKRCLMVLPARGKSKPASFHCNYKHYKEMADPKEKCPVCLNIIHPDPPVIIKEFEYSWLECHREAQGKLFGKCHLLSKVHSEHFYDLSDQDMINIMKDLKRSAAALNKVTNAVKINYEIHGNSIPHLHIHLFPRYVDDEYHGTPIDYHAVKPSPYESKEEFDWFVNQMRALL